MVAGCSNVGTELEYANRDSLQLPAGQCSLGAGAAQDRMSRNSPCSIVPRSKPGGVSMALPPFALEKRGTSNSLHAPDCTARRVGISSKYRTKFSDLHNRLVTGSAYPAR